MHEPLALEDLRLDREPGRLNLSCRVRARGLDLPERFWFAVEHPDDVVVWPVGDAFLPVAVLLGMRQRRPLVVEAEVSPMLLASTARIMETYRAWSGIAGTTFVPIPIEGKRRQRQPAGTTTGLFFSGGVDSFYSLARNLTRYPPGDARTIRYLLLIRGFDMREEARSLFEAVRAQAQAAAAALDKRLVVIATNAQKFLHGIDWEHYAHGAVLAGAALTVQSLLHTVYVPSPGLSPTFRPCGVHPGMDPLWSTDELEFVSDGVAVSRLDKVRELGRVPAALEFLRVCWENLDGALNCGRCEKCLRTMLELEVSGLLERTATLPRKVEPAALHRLRLPGYVLPMWLEVLRELDAHRPGAPLTLAVERLVRRAEWDRTRLGRIYSTGRARIGRRLNREVIARADERYLGGALGALFRGTQAAARRIRISR